MENIKQKKNFLFILKKLIGLILSVGILPIVFLHDTERTGIIVLLSQILSLIGGVIGSGLLFGFEGYKPWLSFGSEGRKVNTSNTWIGALIFTILGLIWSGYFPNSLPGF